MGALLHIRPPYYRAHRMAPGRWAVVHTLPSATTANGPLALLAVDMDGFPNETTAQIEADWRNAERETDQKRLADEQRACGLRWEQQA